MSKFKLQEDSPFTKDEAVWIITNCSPHSPLQAWRDFIRHFGIVNIHAVPSRQTFSKLFKRFRETGCVLPKVSPAVRRVRTEANIQRVDDYFTANPEVHLRQASNDLNISLMSTQRIIRKDLRWHPYVKKHVTKLTPQHEERR